MSFATCQRPQAGAVHVVGAWCVGQVGLVHSAPGWVLHWPATSLRAVLCGIMKYGVAPPTQHCKSVESSAMSHFMDSPVTGGSALLGSSHCLRHCCLHGRTMLGVVASLQDKCRSLPLPSARACVRPAASVFHSFLRQPLRRLLSCALMTDATAVVLCRSMAMARCPCR